MISSIFLYFVSIFASREWQDQWFFLAIFCYSVIAWKLLIPKLGRLAAVTITYMLFSGTFFWLFRENRYFTVEQYDQQALRFFASDSVAKMLMVIGTVLLLAKSRSRFLDMGGLASLIFIIVNMVSQFGQIIRHIANHLWPCSIENSCGGAIGNPSMSISFMIAVLPVAMKQATPQARRWMVFAVFISALISKSSIALGMLAAGGVIYFLMQRKYIWFTLAPIPIAIGHFTLGRDLFSSGTRFEMWKLFMHVWAFNPVNWLWGMGYGTFGVFSRNIQHTLADPELGPKYKKALGLSESLYVQDKNWWTWLHNDWLQMLFETGVIGLALFTLLYFKILTRFFCRDEKFELASAILFGIVMLLNYPLHMHLPTLFGAWLAIAALLKSRDELQG